MRNQKNQTTFLPVLLTSYPTKQFLKHCFSILKWLFLSKWFDIFPLMSRSLKITKKPDTKKPSTKYEYVQSCVVLAGFLGGCKAQWAGLEWALMNWGQANISIGWFRSPVGGLRMTAWNQGLKGGVPIAIAYLAITIVRSHWVDPHQCIQIVQFQECSAHARHDATVMCTYGYCENYVLSHMLNGFKLSAENYCMWLHSINGYIQTR